MKQKRGLSQGWNWLRNANILDDDLPKNKRQYPKPDALDERPDDWFMEWCIPECRGTEHIIVSLTRSFWSEVKRVRDKEEQGWVPKEGKGIYLLKRLLKLVHKYEQTYQVQIRCEVFDVLLCDRIERALELPPYSVSTGETNHADLHRT